MSTPKPVQRLDAMAPQAVQYAVPLWLRDEQIKRSIARVKARIEPHPPRLTPDERVAVVCFGPSLNDTWEAVKDFRFVISCSGSHRFLVERGIVPTWHVEVDPRKHKIALIGQPHPEVEYLIASTCAPEVFDHLEGMNVRLWHVFDSSAEAIRTLPAGEWAITGGCNVGLRALGIAAFFGFRDVHVFGMDGCEGASGKHAAEHPNQPKGYALTTYDGVEYRTTPAMLEAARQTFHELDQLPDVNVTFHGDGLVQAMAKNHVRKSMVVPALKNVVGFAKELLITPEYRALNAQLHRENLAYGVNGGRHAPTVIKLMEVTKSRSCLDYGCGKGGLAKAMPYGICEYDPCVAGKEESPKPADLVVCTDVLEHIEMDRLRFVLDDLRRCLLKFGYFVIHTGPAQKHLADGRNAHLIQRDRMWWKKKLRKCFTIQKLTEHGPELHVLVTPNVERVKKDLKRLVKVTQGARQGAPPHAAPRQQFQPTLQPTNEG